jgi:hypothetical protein
MALLIYLNTAPQSAAFTEKTTILKNIGVFVGERRDHGIDARTFSNRSRVCA